MHRLFLFLMVSIAVFAISCSEGNNCEFECCTHEDCKIDERCLDSVCILDPPECGENLGPGCSSQLPRPECETGGGEWVCDSPTSMTCCNCPTGDGGCPCWTRRHCRGYCKSERDIYTHEECESIMVGVCSEDVIQRGCGCFINDHEENGGFWMACYD